MLSYLNKVFTISVLMQLAWVKIMIAISVLGSHFGSRGWCGGVARLRVACLLALVCLRLLACAV